MLWNIDDVPVYVAVCEQHSITAAAGDLNISKSTVSKALSRLEEGLGVRLLERNSRNVRITSEGEVFLRHAQLILEQVREADAVMAGLTSEPFGRLVVALPMAFAREFVAPRLERFRQRYPRIDLEVVITSHPVDVIRDRIDIAVVVGSLNDSEVVARRLYEGRLLWVASPAYAAGRQLAGDETDLRQHIHVCEQRYGQAQFPVRVNGEKRLLDLSSGVMHVNDPIAVREAVMSGCGVSPLPEQYCKAHIQAGRLMPVFEHIGFEASASKLSAIYPGRRLLSNKTRAFLEFLIEICDEI